MQNFKGRKILKTSEKENSISPRISNGFIGAVISAYNRHYNLKLRPDDMWVAITSAFAKYVEENAE